MFGGGAVIETVTFMYLSASKPAYRKLRFLCLRYRKPVGYIRTLSSGTLIITAASILASVTLITVELCF